MSSISHMPAEGKGRITELDALRGIAAFGVMLFHFTALYNKDVGHLDAPPFELAAGNYGVQLFFVISGFVIYMSVARTQSAMDFVVSRFARLYPAYWTALGLSALFVYTIGLPSQRLPLTDLAVNVTMLQELLHFRHLDGSYWTLQIELLFYAQMLFWFITGQLRRPHTIIGGWLALVLLYHVCNARGIHLSWTLGQLLIVEHIPFFALGMLFYRIYCDAQHTATDHVMVATCLGVIGLTRPAVYGIAALTCIVVFYLLVYGRLRWLQRAPFTFLGTISYSLYLLHEAIGFGVIWHLEHDAHSSSTVAILAAILVSLVLATTVTFWVERPAMRWLRRRWEARQLAVIR